MKKNIVNLFSLESRVAIITGGAGMLGSEFAKAFLDAGAKVVIFDIQKKVSQSAEPSLDYMTVDVTKRKQVFSAVRRVAKKYGYIDVLVNNAAMNPVPGGRKSGKQFSSYETYSQNLWQKELDVTLSGALFCTQAVAPFMRKQRRGSIINIASIYGNVAPDNRLYGPGKYKSVAYATAKGGLLNFTRAWASYFSGKGVRINSLTLGGVFSGQARNFVKRYKAKTMLGRMAEKSEYNGAILFLASDASRYMSGANLIVDGGWTAW